MTFDPDDARMIFDTTGELHRGLESGEILIGAHSETPDSIEYTILETRPEGARTIMTGSIPRD